MKEVSNLGTPKGSADTTKNSVQTAQNLCWKVECTIVGRDLYLTAINPTRQETRKYVENTKKKLPSRIK